MKRSVAVVIASVLAACGGSTGSSSTDGGTTAVPGSQIAGNYAIRVKTALNTTFPAIGVVPSTDTWYGTGSIEINGTAFALVVSGCHEDINSSDQRAQVNVPDAVPRSEVDETSTLTVDAAATPITVKRPTFTVLRGAKLAKPDSDPLPMDPTDPTVVDSDKDSHPGITVNISGSITADAYLAQRRRDSYTMTVSSDGAISGSLISEWEQNVLDNDATNGLVHLGLKGSLTTTQDPDATKSGVVLVKTDTALACDALISQKSTLFPTP